MGKDLSRIRVHLIYYGVFSLSVLTRPAAVDSTSLINHRTILPLSSQSPVIRAQEGGSGCPRDLEALTTVMLKDLPSYANRVIQRSLNSDRRENLYGYVIIAGRPEFEPLPLYHGYSQYPSQFPNTTKQIFFTTLERQYQKNKAVNLQNYHWLFLTETSQGWQLVMSFTQFGSPIPEGFPSPPIDSTNGIMGQAVQLWLRDCNSE